MNARDEILAHPGVLATADAEIADLLNKHRTEVIAKAIGRLRAIPVDCTALTGPVWYGSGWKDCIAELEGIADYQRPDDEAHPGELQRLRALNFGLRAALLRRDDVAWARQQLISLAEHEARERSGQAAPDFFQPGHAYTHRNGTDFHCVAVTTHPQTGERLAMGWHIDSWGLHYPTTVGINQWRHEYDGVEAPTDTTTGEQ